MRTALLGIISTVLLSSPVSAQTPSQSTQDSVFPMARLAFFNAQRVAAESAIGRAATARLEAFRSKTASEVEEKNKALQAEQQKLQQTASVLSATARAETERNLQKFEIDLQRFMEDAQAEFLGLQREVESDFRLKLLPVVEHVAKDKGVHFVFNQPDSGIFWADPAFDITADIITRLDRAAPADN